ncbi:probable C-mannosyltransferase DPY19L4 isoform X3 [Syngnathoides biaculeatus]|uniref:probable C-mannosyltransferase DPY19L4 isoform X3 n=1 Tax=Syngnathoides biaculeatus TaxID=300417 RepID=UPI002ADDBF8D|nr:probable C-mannosyltransferase DPY19L4 isoform X3 [Syngnathoides biaculeatus]
MTALRRRTSETLQVAEKEEEEEDKHGDDGRVKDEVAEEKERKGGDDEEGRERKEDESDKREEDEEEEETGRASKRPALSAIQHVLRLFFGCLAAVACGTLYAAYLSAFHERKFWFSTRQEVERELTFQGGSGIYYYYYKHLLAATSFNRAFYELTADDGTVAGQTINAVERLSLYPEVVTSYVYRVSGGKDFVEPIYFYVGTVLALQAAYATALFVCSWLMSGTWAAGALAVAWYAVSRADATKVEQALPLRENWALPCYACQVAALTGFLSNNVGSPAELLCFVSMSGSTLTFLLVWEHSHYVLFVQAFCLFLLDSLDLVPPRKMSDIHKVYLSSLLLAFFFHFHKAALLGSPLLSLLIGSGLARYLQQTMKKGPLVARLLKLFLHFHLVFSTSASFNYFVKKIVPGGEGEFVLKFLEVKFGLSTTNGSRLPRSGFVPAPDSRVRPAVLPAGSGRLRGLRAAGRPRQTQRPAAPAGRPRGRASRGGLPRPSHADLGRPDAALRRDEILVDAVRVRVCGVRRVLAGPVDERLRVAPGQVGPARGPVFNPERGRADHHRLQPVARVLPPHLGRAVGASGVPRPRRGRADRLDPDRPPGGGRVRGQPSAPGSRQGGHRRRRHRLAAALGRRHAEEERGRETYQVYSMRSAEEVYKILTARKANYVIVEESLCNQPASDRGCRVKDLLDVSNGHVLDDDAETLAFSGRRRFCHEIKTDRSPYANYFTRVFWNRSYHVYRVNAVISFQY